MCFKKVLRVVHILCTTQYVYYVTMVSNMTSLWRHNIALRHNITSQWKMAITRREDILVNLKRGKRTGKTHSSIILSLLIMMKKRNNNNNKLKMYWEKKKYLEAGMWRRSQKLLVMVLRRLSFLWGCGILHAHLRLQTAHRLAQLLPPAQQSLRRHLQHLQLPSYRGRLWLLLFFFLLLLSRTKVFQSLRPSTSPVREEFCAGQNRKSCMRRKWLHLKFCWPSLFFDLKKRGVVSVAWRYVRHALYARRSRRTGSYRLYIKKKETEKKMFENYNLFEEHENGVVQLSKLTDLLQSFSMHYKSECKNPDPVVVSSKRKGLCLECTCICRTCKFKSCTVKLYEECRVGSRGPASGTINEGLMMSTVKTKVGPTDLSVILGCMNVKPLSNSLMYEKMNRICDTMKSMNEEALVQNQKFVANFCEASGNSVSVETDSSFNNRIQAGYEAGTMSFSPMIEQSTVLHLPISATIFNKLCSKSEKCQHHDNECNKNYAHEESMSSSEKKALVQNLENVNSNGIISVSSVTTDASAQVEKVIADYNATHGSKVGHQLCFVHRMRTLQKHVKKVRLDHLPVAAKDRDAYMQKVAYCIRIRAHQELVKLRSRYPARLFLARAPLVLKNSVKCFCGDHSGCKLLSLVCKFHLKSHTYAHLPLGQPLQCSQHDRLLLQNEILKILSRDVLTKLVALRTTNKSETMHRRAFTYAPKNTAWRRNFPALCHSALHSSAYGTGGSMMMLSKKLNIPYFSSGPFRKVMTKRDKRTVYENKRSSTLHAKQRRFKARKKRCNNRFERIASC